MASQDGSHLNLGPADKPLPHPTPTHIWTSQPEGRSNCYSDPEGRFSIVAADDGDARGFLRMDAYSAALAFVEGRFAVHGDIFSAIRFFSDHSQSRLRHLLFSITARLENLKMHSFSGGRKQAAEKIQFHYDRSNEFYKLFLDSRMIYSAAHFSTPEQSLEEAQVEKLDRICRDLQLKPEDRFLDIGCGWGGLIDYASSHFGVSALGCTLSERQLQLARDLVQRHGLERLARVEPLDYRDLTGCFDKIASVGMFEHVGRDRLRGYFEKIHSLLGERGLFLNRGVVRPKGVSDGPETLFLQKNVFPGGELVHLEDVTREGERAGLDVIGVEDLHKHYALT